MTMKEFSKPNDHTTIPTKLINRNMKIENNVTRQQTSLSPIILFQEIALKFDHTSKPSPETRQKPKKLTEYRLLYTNNSNKVNS